MEERKALTVFWYQRRNLVAFRAKGRDDEAIAYAGASWHPRSYFIKHWNLC